MDEFCGRCERPIDNAEFRVTVDRPINDTDVDRWRICSPCWDRIIEVMGVAEQAGNTEG